MTNPTAGVEDTRTAQEPLGAMLVRRGLLTAEQLDAALAEQKASGDPLGKIVVALGFATPAIIGGRRLKVAATLAYDEFLNTLNWPLGAAVATLLLVALVLIVVGSNALIERRYAGVFR